MGCNKALVKTSRMKPSKHAASENTEWYNANECLFDAGNITQIKKTNWFQGLLKEDQVELIGHKYRENNAKKIDEDNAQISNRDEEDDNECEGEPAAAYNENEEES